MSSLSQATLYWNEQLSMPRQGGGYIKCYLLEWDVSLFVLTLEIPSGSPFLYDLCFSHSPHGSSESHHDSSRGTEIYMILTFLILNLTTTFYNIKRHHLSFRQYIKLYHLEQLQNVKYKFLKFPLESIQSQSKNCEQLFRRVVPNQAYPTTYCLHDDLIPG